MLASGLFFGNHARFAYQQRLDNAAIRWPGDCIAGRAQMDAKIKRFWSKVVKTEGCWMWTAFRMSGKGHGYGQLTYNYKRYLAHRLAWILTFGPIPDGLCVLHKCDNPACINPTHLFLGTQLDNLADMRAKGRHSKGPTIWGERHGMAKLTGDDVRSIRAAHVIGVSIRILGQEYRVNRKTITKILSGASWKHLEQEGK